MKDMTQSNIKKYSIWNLIILVMAIIVIVGVGTYAWLSYRSKNTAMVLTVGDINNVQITLKPYQLDLSLSPKLTLDTSNANTDYVTVTVANNSSSARNFKLFYDIHEIDSGLQNSNFRYTIVKTNDSSTTTGNFANANTTNDFYILDGSIPGGTTYIYKVYTWLYGNSSNTPGLTFKGDLRASIAEGQYQVMLNANGGSVSPNTIMVSYGGTYGSLPTPTRTGYTFLGWNGRNIFNPRTMTLSNTTFNSTTEEVTFSSGVWDRILDKLKWTPMPSTTYTIVVDVSQNTFNKEIQLITDERFYIEQYNNKIVIPASTVNKYVSSFTTRDDFSNVTLGSFWFNTNSAVTGTFKTKLAIYEGTDIVSWEPYYITSSTTVVQNNNHTLTAMWQKNP